MRQYVGKSSPPAHQFAVFSVIDDDGNVQQSYAQCNNCGIVHKIIEINKSKILANEDLKSSITVDDIKQTMNEKYASILEKYDVDLATWQQVSFILENELWGSVVVLTKEKFESDVNVKLLHVIGKTLLKIVDKSTKEIVE
jgi:uncharacterized FlaG/YvyC family protein